VERQLGKYQTVRPIASGGMAAVYLGKAVGVGGFERFVAIKVMHPHIAHERDYVEMFLDEARLAARIRHPNVVPVIDVEKDAEGVPFIVMEFIEGPTLGQMLKLMRRHQDALPIDIALRIMCDVLNGLHAAHELRGKDKQPLNLVHRDVSPQNIMVGYDGITRLTDFGVARARVRIHTTRSSQIKGKLAYLPPEQLSEETPDRRADVYGAGVVLWEALTGQRLFKAETEAKLIMRLLEGAKLHPREVNPDVPEAIDAAVMKALAMAPDDRYGTAAEFADALEDAAMLGGGRVANSRAVADYAKSLPLDVTSTSEAPPPMGAEPPALLSEPPTRVTSGSSLTTGAGAASEIAATARNSGGRGALMGVVALAVAVAAVGLYVSLTGSSASSETAPLAPAAAAPTETTAAAPSAEVVAATSASAEPSATAAASAGTALSNGLPSAAPEQSAQTAKTTRGPIKAWTPKPKSTAYRPDDL